MGEPTNVHSLKCWPEPFEAMLCGDKTAEFRYNDRDYAVGDRLRIQEWCPQSESYTGREIERVVSHVLSAGYGIPEGYAMLSLAHARTIAEAEARIKQLEDECFRLAAGVCINPGQHGLVGDERGNGVCTAYEALLAEQRGAKRQRERDAEALFVQALEVRGLIAQMLYWFRHYGFGQGRPCAQDALDKMDELLKALENPDG